MFLCGAQLSFGWHCGPQGGQPVCEACALSMNTPNVATKGAA